MYVYTHAYFLTASYTHAEIDTYMHMHQYAMFHLHHKVLEIQSSTTPTLKRMCGRAQTGSDHSRIASDKSGTTRERQKVNAELRSLTAAAGNLASASPYLK